VSPCLFSLYFLKPVVLSLLSRVLLRWHLLSLLLWLTLFQFFLLSRQRIFYLDGLLLLQCRLSDACYYDLRLSRLREYISLCPLVLDFLLGVRSLEQAPIAFLTSSSCLLALEKFGLGHHDRLASTFSSLFTH
jgi:hypothetical protein